MSALVAPQVVDGEIKSRGVCLSRRALLGLVGFATIGSVEGRRDLTASKLSVQLRRGVAIHTALNWPQKRVDGAYLWPPFPHALERLPVSAIRAAGFDFLRLTVNPAIFGESHGIEFEQLTAVLDTCINHILKHGLNLVLDIHSVAQDRLFGPDQVLTAQSGSGGLSLVEIQVALAKVLKKYPQNRVALELWNEPNISPDRREDWQDLQQISHRRVRATAAELTLILTGVGGGLEDLTRLDPRRVADENTYYTFHYYNPMPFTHQGIVAAAKHANPEQFFSNVPFPMTKLQADQAIADAITKSGKLERSNSALAEKVASELRQYATYLHRTLDSASIAVQFEKVREWARAGGLETERILLGEFGVMRPHVDHASRLRWLAAVRTQAEHMGFPWCRWSFDNPISMGMTSRPNSTEIAPGELIALGLNGRRRQP